MGEVIKAQGGDKYYIFCSDCIFIFIYTFPQ